MFPKMASQLALGKSAVSSFTGLTFYLCRETFPDLYPDNLFERRVLLHGFYSYRESGFYQVDWGPGPMDPGKH